MKFTIALSMIVLALDASMVSAQTTEPTQDQAGHQHTVPGKTKAQPTTVAGPQGGSIKQAGELQIETVVSQAGLQMFVYDGAGNPVSVDRGRGAVSVRIEGNPKRYRYDLLPNGKKALTAPVNLSPLAGRQIDVDVQLVGIANAGTIRFSEVATVPVSEQQLAAAAIARQKTCPVSGKPLGSMGEPIAVDVGGPKVYVCCAGCVNAVESNPAKYASGRPEITVTIATQADASAIAAQKVCPVMDEPLGGMGTPIKMMIGDNPIYLCCKGCIKKVQAEPAKYLAMVDGDEGGSGEVRESGSVAIGTEQIREGVFKVSAADASFIAAQKNCPVMDEPLDAMGGPFKVNAAGQAIYICCPGCAKRIAAEPQKYLAILKSRGVEAPTIR